MRAPSVTTTVPVATAGDQENVTMTGSPVGTAQNYEERFVCLYTETTGIHYTNNGVDAAAGPPSKSLKPGERFFDFIPPGGSLSFFGSSGVVEIIPFGEG